MHRFKKLLNFLRRECFLCRIRLQLKRNNTDKIVKKVDSLDSVWKKRRIKCYMPEISSRRKSSLGLSIIVPLYNSENFVDGLIKPLVEQKTDYKYEVILVNDGSTDKTAEKVKRYLKRYSVIKYVEKENGGISSARNVALEMAGGRYIGFLDHDDYVSKDYVEKMLRAAYENNADVVKCATANVRDGKIINKESRQDEIIHGKMGMKILNYPSYIWAAIYKSDLMMRVRFPEGYWYEDMVTRFYLYRMANVFVNISEALHYRVSHKNQTTKKVWSNKEYKCLEQLYLIEQLAEENRKNQLDEDVFLYLNVLLECSSVMVRRIEKMDDEIRQQVFLRAKRLLKGLWKEEYTPYLKGEWKMKNDVIMKGRYDLWLLEKYL